jgi:hypothetical protein
MSLWFDLIQSCEISEQRDKQESLEQRVERLEKLVNYLVARLVEQSPSLVADVEQR